MCKTIFISGKITGLDYDNEVVPKFEYVKYLAEQHFGKDNKFITPTDLIAFSNDEKYTKAVWYKSMRICIKNLLKSNIVIFCSDWKDSKGARIEHFLSKLFFKCIFYTFDNKIMKITKKEYDKISGVYKNCSF